MVIQRHGTIPEVRLYPPESYEHEINNGYLSGQHVQLGASIVGRNPIESTLQNWMPFHMRPANLAAFPASIGAYRTSYRAQSVAIQRVKAGWVSSTAKSLDIVRQNLQSVINKELDVVIRRYIDKFFTPAIENIRRNNGEQSVSDEHVQIVCRQILDEAKRMYNVTYTRGSTPLVDCSDSETGSHSDGRLTGPSHRKSPSNRKRKDSDTDSEASQKLRPVKKKLGRPPLAFSPGVSGRLTPSKQLKSQELLRREGPKWDPVRLTEDTQFVMGARANKALGFGLTRGRLYMKHPEIFKYGGDSEDKQWLYDNNLMPATGGKAYLLVLNDIHDLAESDEYRNSPTVNVYGLVGFTVPAGMLAKIKTSMSSLRTETSSSSSAATMVKSEPVNPAKVIAATKPRARLISTTSTFDVTQSRIECSAPASPVDDLDLLSGVADSRSPPVSSPSPYTIIAAVEPGYVDDDPMYEVTEEPT